MYSACSLVVQADHFSVAEVICYGPAFHRSKAELGYNIRNAMRASIGIILRSSDDARATNSSCSYTERVSAENMRNTLPCGEPRSVWLADCPGIISGLLNFTWWYPYTSGERRAWIGGEDIYKSEGMTRVKSTIHISRSSLPRKLAPV